MPRPEHPLVVALVEAYAREIHVPPADLWRWLDRQERPPEAILRGLVDAFYPMVRPEDFEHGRLTSEHEHNTLSAMDPTTSVLKSRARQTPQGLQHPAIQAWYDAGITVLDASRILSKRLRRKVPRSTVQSWYKPAGDVARRRIPGDAAKACLELWGIPLSAWGGVRPV